MSMIEDAQEFGKSYGAKGCYGTYSERLKCLQNARATAASLVPKFFKDYPDYRYIRSNAEIVFQVLYFTVNDEILKLLIWTNEENYKKFTAEIFANDLYNDLTGERSGIRRSIPAQKTPYTALEENYIIETGLQPSELVKQQLRYIVSAITKIARSAGYTENNLNWNDVNLHLQPNLTSIPRESISEIIEEYRELFTPPTIREELKDAKAIYNDYRYGIIIAWFGGSTFNVFYKGKEIGMFGNDAATSVEQAQKIMAETVNSPDYPEFVANDEETYRELENLKKKK